MHRIHNIIVAFVCWQGHTVTAAAAGHGKCRASLDGIAERRAGAVHLQRGPVSRRHVSVQQGRPDDLARHMKRRNRQLVLL